MARYDHLSIYRSAMRLAVHLENTVRGFPRYVKYTQQLPLHEGEGRGEGGALTYQVPCPLIRPLATFSRREKG
jgi:hypothetical protein